MAYGKYSRGARTTRTRRSYPKRTGSSAYRKVVKPTRQAIPALAKQVASLQRAVKPLSQNKLMYHYQVNNQPIGNLSGNGYYVVNLSSTGQWQRVFGTDTDDESSHCFIQQRSTFKYMIDAATQNEGEMIPYTIALVTLTKIGATELFNPGNGALNVLNNQTHYISSGLQGQGTLLNKRYFNIHYYRNMTTNFLEGSSTDGASTRSGTIRYNKPITWKTPAQDWRIKTYNPNACGNLYMLIFSSDSTADADVVLRLNGLIQGVAV